jgi:hypothetical protein
MKKTGFLGLLLIAILELMVVPANAFVNPNPTTPQYNPTVNSNYELYGPHVAGITCDIYTTGDAEWTAMNSPNSYGTGSAALDLEDSRLTTAWISAWTGTKAFTVQNYGGENGYFVLDMNNNATQPDGTVNPMADINIREAIAYLVNRTNIVDVIAGGLGLLPMYTFCPPYMSTMIDNSITPTGGNASLCYSYGTISPVGPPGNDNSWPFMAYTILNSDPYICYNGSQPGTVAGKWYDDYLKLGTWVLMPTMTFYVRSDDPEREEIGDMVWGATGADGTYTSYPFGGSNPMPALPITEVAGTAGAIEGPVMNTKDFAMYTGAWTGIGPTPDVFFDLYAQENYWAPGFCANYDHTSFDNTYGGTYPWASNESQLETYLRQDFCATTTMGGVQAAKNAQYEFALDCDAVPLYCHSGDKAVSDTPANQPSSGPWMQMVNLPSIGMNNWYTLLSTVDPTATSPSNLYINYGFRSDLKMQNILYYSWYWDSIVLGEIYDSGATLDPVTLSQWVPQLFENWSLGTYTSPVYGPCTYVNLTLRPDVYWQDGVPLTMADVIYTLTQCGNDLIADGLPPPWWWPTVSYFVGVEQIDAYNIQILLNIQSVWALAWVISSVIIPMHIWQPMISNYVPSDAGVQGKDPTMSFADPYEVGSGPYRFHTYSSVAPAYAVLDANLRGSTETGEYSGPAITSGGYWQYYPLRVDISLGPSNLARVATSTPAWGEVSYYANINLYNLVTSGTLTVNKYVYIVNDTSMASAAADLATATPIITDIGLALAPGGGSPFSISTYDVVPSDTEYVPFTATQPNAVVIKVACQITGDTGITTTAGPSYVGAWINATQPLWFTSPADIGGSNLYADLTNFPSPVTWTYTSVMAAEIPTPDLKPTASLTSVSCSPNLVSSGLPVTCTAAVSGFIPTGIITWSTSSSTGNFSQSVCTLSSGSCSTTYTDSSPGSVTIAAYYSGDSINLPSSGSATLTVVSSGPVYYSENYSSVQAAINAAPNRSNVIVAAGTYHEYLILDKKLTLIGDSDQAGFGGGGSGIFLTVFSGASGSIITGIEITNYDDGILLYASNCKIYGNAMSSMGESGIVLEGSSATGDIVYDNAFQDTPTAINLADSAGGNTIYGNIISSQATVTLSIGTDDNTVYENVISGSSIILNMTSSMGNTFYHNDFLAAVQIVAAGSNTWDNTSSSGGNYWSDYQTKYPSAVEIGTSGIWNTPYVIYTNNQDNYPLMNPYALAVGQEVAVSIVVSAKTVIMQGYTGNVTVTVFNEGQYNETFSVTAYANTTMIGTQQVSNLSSVGQITLTFTWNTTGSAIGKYTIGAYAWPIAGETNVADNNFTDGLIYVSMVGDLTGTTPFVPDGKCDGRDITVVAKCFGSKLGDPNYNPNCDILNRGKIDGRDITIVAKNFGKQDPTWPPWL